MKLRAVDDLYSAFTLNKDYAINNPEFRLLKILQDLYHQEYAPSNQVVATVLKPVISLQTPSTTLGSFGFSLSLSLDLGLRVDIEASIVTHLLLGVP